MSQAYSDSGEETKHLSYLYIFQLVFTRTLPFIQASLVWSSGIDYTGGTTFSVVSTFADADTHTHGPPGVSPEFCKFQYLRNSVPAEVPGMEPCGYQRLTVLEFPDDLWLKW